ncbi:hypothetical protein AJ78_03897 [Emergomyces pasteurianus Ep9510]|uniref:Cytochrome P450 n=1 Tax=Emergomyces pasteurianus Ep9510 TaxID=1447872 RepID=A0A1J9QI91_9EURO|nr:hypothetical protein AJ78_03897 [Emergomyces pasteurianus Ep9510]
MAILFSFLQGSPAAPLGLVASSVTSAAIIWYAAVVVYRLYFHPLATIPGPWLARATHLYCFYYNCILGGRFYLEVERMHKKYGPVVRISPDEIHLCDPENYDKINYVGTPYFKSPVFYGGFGTDKATFTTPSNEIHRVKRAALNPFFSPKRVLELEGIVQSKARKLEERMKSQLQTSGSIDLHNGFRAISVDVITDYAFDNCYNLLEQEDFGVPFFNMIRDTGTGIWFFQQFPSLQPIAFAIPFWLAKIVSESLTMMMKMHQSCRRQILRVKAAVDAAEEPRTSRVTIFHQLLKPDSVKEYTVPTVEQLVHEAYIVVAAAADTTGNAMTIALYNSVLKPEIYTKLTAEMKGAFPDPDAELDLSTLEKLPYLNAVIKESLRLSFGVIGRLPRVVPASGAEFNGYTVPPGTIVSMSSWMMHRNENIFPDPDTFDPSRWLNPATSKILDRYLVAFGKGSRKCVGMP